MKTSNDIVKRVVFLIFIAGVPIVNGRAQSSAPVPTPEAKSSTQLGSATQEVPAGVQAKMSELMKDIQSAQRLLGDAQKLMTQSQSNALPAQTKLTEALGLFRSVSERLGDNNLKQMVTDSGPTAPSSLNTLRAFSYFAKVGESMALTALAFTYSVLGNWEKNVFYLKETLAVFRQITSNPAFVSIPSVETKEQLFSIRFQEAMMLGDLGGTVETRLGQPEEGSSYLLQSVDRLHALYQERPEADIRLQEAMLRVRLGLASGRELQNTRQAIEHLQFGLNLFREIPGHEIEVADTLNQIGSFYSVEQNFSAALENWDAAFLIYKGLDDRQGQVAILSSKARMFDRLDDQTKVRELANQVLQILQTTDYVENVRQHHFPQQAELTVFNDLNGAFIEGLRVFFIGQMYEMLLDYQNAIKYYEQSLANSRARNEPSEIRNDLIALGRLYSKMENWESALDYFRLALEVSRKENVKDELASDLADLGQVLTELKRPGEALTYQNQAVVSYLAIGADARKRFATRYHLLLSEMAVSYAAIGNRRLAIIFGKAGVNAIQEQRQQMRNFDSEQQRGFLRRKEKYYRSLHGWLVEAGRLAEAEQVLAMLKNDEYSRSLRFNDTEAAETGLGLGLDPVERAANAEFERLGSEVSRTGAKLGTLETKKKNLGLGGSLEAVDQAEYERLKAQMEIANSAFTSFLDELRTRFRDTGKPIEFAKSNLQEFLKNLSQPHTAIVTVIVGEDRLSLILITPDSRSGYTVPVKQSEVEDLVREFRAALMDPLRDSRPAGQRLYQLLFPVNLKKNLDNIQADTIIWSLDGPLRYVPMAALSPDGKSYLIERYNTAVLTLAAQEQAARAPGDRSRWQVFGVGVSQPAEVREWDGTTRPFGALKAVPSELCGIVDDPSKRAFCAPFMGGRAGLMRGLILPDSEFTRAKFDAFYGQSPVVHIASHFRLRVGSEEGSYLLLGGGGTFSLTDLRNAQPRTLDLLTLSACNTAMSGGVNGNGLEVERFSALAQNQGANAVVATLWSVADPSTRDAMIEFYRQLETHREVGKAEALRRAQLALLRGTLPATSGETVHSVDPGPRDTVDVAGYETPPASRAPAFTPDPKRPYAHPYYWAPFVLYGNWR